jgi:hypothetical protein
MGMDVFGFRQGVIGQRGFIPLEDTTLFCSTECLAKKYRKGSVTDLGERIP